MPGRFPSQASCSSCNIERSTPRSGADPEIPERGGRGNCDENTHHRNKFCNASLMTMEYVQIRVNCRSTLGMLAGVMNP